MNKLRDQKGLTMVELLVTVVIVLLFSGLVAVGADAGVWSFRTSMADAQAQELCSTLTTALSDKLRYCTVENDPNRIFFQDIGYVSGTVGDIFSVNGNAEIAFRAVHTMKGLCLTLGLSNLTAPASELTELLRNGCLDGSETLYNRLALEYTKTIELLKAVD